MQSNEVACEGAPRRVVLREYVGSDENRLVQLAVDSLLDGGRPYCPLVFYGPSGTGKTLLALGLGERWRQQAPDDSVIVTNGTDFARSYANALDTDALVAFRRKSRSADMFVLDDLHLMRTRRTAQEELARLIDAQLQQGAHLVFTSGTAPAADDGLVPSLRSRLAAGLTVPLTAPGIGARRVLLRRLAEMHAVHLTDGAVELLAGDMSDAGSVRLTVPQLNHAVVQLSHSAPPVKQSIDVDEVRVFLDDQQNQRRPTLRSIAHKVAKYFSLTTQQLRGPSRRQLVVRARGVAMYLGWNLSGSSLQMVGKYFGNRDHTTVLHACRKTEALQNSDPAVAKALKELQEQLHAP